MCSEYLAMFKKTVAMHEVFLQRLTAHPRLRGDSVFTVFLEFDGDVSNLIHIYNHVYTNYYLFFCVVEYSPEKYSRTIGKYF